MLVNVVEIMQIDLLKTVKKNTLGCSLLQRLVIIIISHFLVHHT